MFRHSVLGHHQEKLNAYVSLSTVIVYVCIKFKNGEVKVFLLFFMEVSISSEFGFPTSIFKLQESFSCYRTMLVALVEPENGYQSLKVKAGESDTVPV